MKFVSTSLFATLLLAGCVGEPDARIKGTEWRVESLGASTKPFADGKATLAFSEEGRVAAYAGCNRMGGSYTVKGKVLTLSQMMSTRMACFPQQKMVDEQELAEALGKVTKVEIKGDKAVLSGADGVVLTLWNKDAIAAD